MKVGDLVQSKKINGVPRRAGLIVHIVEKKCWRTHILGKKVDWARIEPEPHGVVLVGDTKLTIPLVDLEPMCEG
tara:strand:+ start:303 stop:524 length:222 start_codon:yes stop_codon:yes gene_type:complete